MLELLPQVDVRRVLKLLARLLKFRVLFDLFKNKFGATLLLHHRPFHRNELLLDLRLFWCQSRSILGAVGRPGFRPLLILVPIQLGIAVLRHL